MVMTPDETKQYIEHRLRELGWGARIDNTGYEKIYRFTDGTEAGANQICYKLLSLGSLQPNREITDDLVNVALDDLTRMDEIVKRSAKAAAQNGGDENDGVSIEQLAAVLEAKVSTGELASEIWTPPRAAPPAATPSPRPALDTNKAGANGARSAPARRNVTPKGATAPPASQKKAPPPERERSPVVTSADRFAPERARSHSFPPSPLPQGSLMQRLYHFSSTATITLGATVLVVVAIAVIMYINRTVPDAAPPLATDPLPAPAPAAVAGTAPEPAAPATPDVTLPPVDTAPAAPGAPVIVKRNEGGAEKETSAEPVTPSKPAPPRESLARANAARAPVVEKPPELTKAPPLPSARTPTVEVKPVEPTAPAASPVAPPSVTETPDTGARVAAARPKISKEELAALMRRFAFVYEAGDADQFANLFAENARTNDKSSREGIREDYQNFFGATDLRQMNLGQVNWEVEDNQAQGWGNFDVTVRRAGEQEVQAYSGSLSFNVEKVDGRLRIVRLYHGQRRAGM
jgi:hypothetical protein